MPDGRVPTLEERLEAALGAGSGFDPRLTAARALLDALARRPRVALMGPPAAPHSAVMALLAGGHLVPPTLTAGSITVTYGATPAATITVSGGKTLSFDGPPDPDVLNILSPLEVTIATPAPALKRLTLMQVAPAPDEAGMRDAMARVAARSEVIIWCSERFSTLEQRLWWTVPAALRDVSLLLLTHGATPDPAVARRAVGDFGGIRGLDLPAALDAARGPVPDLDGLSDSGAMGLTASLLSLFKSRRAALAAQAEAVLQDLHATPAPRRPVPEPSMEMPVPSAPDDPDDIALPAPSVAEPEVGIDLPAPSTQIDTDAVTAVLGEVGHGRSSLAPRLPDARAFEAAARLIEDETDDPVVAPKRRRATLEEGLSPDFDRAAHRLKPAPVVAAPPPHPAMPQVANAACEDAVARLQNVGARFANDSSDPHAVLDASVDALIWLDGLLMDAGPVDHPRFARLQQMTGDAVDLVQLLQLEGDVSAGIEAATVLLQIKRGCQAALAA